MVFLYFFLISFHSSSILFPFNHIRTRFLSLLSFSCSKLTFYPGPPSSPFYIYLKFFLLSPPFSYFPFFYYFSFSYLPTHSTKLFIVLWHTLLFLLSRPETMHWLVARSVYKMRVTLCHPPDWIASVSRNDSLFFLGIFKKFKTSFLSSSPSSYKFTQNSSSLKKLSVILIFCQPSCTRLELMWFIIKERKKTRNLFSLFMFK